MSAFALLFSYLGWHYTLGLLDLLAIWRNLIWFAYHFFSIPVLVRTWVAPWRRLGESYPTGALNISAKLEVLVVNTLMRVVGLVARTFVVFLGLLVCLILALLGLLALGVWLVLPWVLVASLVIGLKLLLA